MNLVTYKNLKQRCTNPNNPMFGDYGKKGVQLLLTYEEFVEIYDRTDQCESCGTKFGSNNRKSDGKTVARIHPRGNYETDNIRVVCRACSKGKPKKTSSKSSKKKPEVVNCPKLYQKPGAGYYFTFKGRQYYAGSTLDKAQTKLEEVVSIGGVPSQSCLVKLIAYFPHSAELVVRVV